MFGLTWEVVGGLIRHLLTFGGGYFVAKGVVDEATMTTIVAGILSVMGGIWSVTAKKKAAE